MSSASTPTTRKAYIHIQTYNTEIQNASNSLQTTTWRQSSASVSTTQINTDKQVN